MTRPASTQPTDARPLGFREFVAMIAALMAVNALGIDIMLPALPEMAHALGLPHENQRQWIIAAYMFGFGSTQLIYGPLADRYGRRPVLIVTLALFAVMSLAATVAYDFTTIVVARVLQGVFAASTRVLTISVVRDRYSGRQMARVMSLSFIVFLAVPILAPSIGQVILLLGSWHMIFVGLGTFGAAVAAWAWLRLPETLDPRNRREISPGAIVAACREVLGNRFSLGYTIALTALFGGLMGFINSVQQIFSDIFHRPALFPIVFAACAGCMALTSFLNSRIVVRLGSRLISHCALLGFIAVGTLHVAFAASGHESIWSFSLFQAATMACFGLTASNFGSMAMEPVGHLAGTGAALQGTISTIGGALIGIVIGQSFDGTTLPVALGFLLVGLGSLLAVLVTEQGRLFRARNAPVPAEQQ